MKRATVLALALLLLFTACGTKDAPQKAAPEAAQISAPTWQEQYDLGMRYLTEGNYQEAIIAFTAAIEIDPKQAEAYIGRGDAYIASGETEENLTAAQKDYETVLALDETNADAYLGLADVYIRLGDYDKALEILHTGLEKTDGNEKIADKITEIETGNIKDSEGKLRRECGYGIGGNLLYWVDYTYDKQGRKAAASAYQGTGELDGIIDYEYDAKGQELVSGGLVITPSRNGSEPQYRFEKIVSAYDEAGNCVKRERFSLTGAFTLGEINQYDGAGNCVRRELYDKGGAQNSYYLYQYNAAGKLSHEDAFFDGGLISSTDYEYDGDGKLIKKHTYDSEGALNGYTIYEYNADGKRIRDTAYDKDGNIEFDRTLDR